MDWLSAPDILEKNNASTEKIEPNLEQEHIIFPYPTAEFKYNGRQYQMTTSASQRITFFTTENHIEPTTVYSGYIGNISYGPQQEERLEAVIFRGDSFEYVISPLHEEFGLVKTAMITYRDTPFQPSQHEGWDRAIENSKRNIAGVLESLAINEGSTQQT